MNKVVPLEGFGGGGSSPLNFKVVGSTTQPKNPKENMIWVQTEYISEYIFDFEEPENPIDNMVWIKIKNSSDIKFNILKKDCLMIYPHGIYQYINDEWIDITSFIYQNNQWHELWIWDGELYDSGDQYVDYTGGWEANRGVKLNGTANSKSKVIFNDDHIQIQLPSAVTTVNKINLSNYKVLYFDVNILNRDDGDRFGVSTKNTGEINSSGPVASKQSGKTGRQIIDIDVSGLNESYYIFALTYGNGSRNIYKVWLE